MKNLTFSINTEHIERIRNEVWQHIMLLTFRNYYTANITWFLEYISVTTSTNVLSNQQQIDFQINQKWKPNFFIGQKVSLTLIKENCHNSRTSDDIDMKLGPVTKLDKRNKTTSKKFDVDFMSENCDIIVIFRIFGQFGAVRRPDSGHRVCKSYVFSNSNLLSYKNWKQN